MPNTQSKNIFYALAYARRGRRVFPLHTPIIQNGGVRCTCRNPQCNSVGKHPRTKRGVFDATINIQAIRRWRTASPHANIGIAMGDGVFALDVDGAEGEKSIQRI